MDRGSYQRVTNIIAPFSGVEFVPQKYLEPAAARGTLVHHYIESFLAGFEKPIDNENIKPYVDSFKLFWEDLKHKGTITLEKRLYCDENEITGQADCIIESDDMTYIFDWKTSANPHIAWRLQSAAYRFLAESSGMNNVQDVVFVKLNKFGKKPTIYKYIDYDEDLARFFECLRLYRFFKMDTSRGWKELT